MGVLVLVWLYTRGTSDWEGSLENSPYGYRGDGKNYEIGVGFTVPSSKVPPSGFVVPFSTDETCVVENTGVNLLFSEDHRGLERYSRTVSGKGGRQVVVPTLTPFHSTV